MKYFRKWKQEICWAAILMYDWLVGWLIYSWLIMFLQSIFSSQLFIQIHRCPQDVYINSPQAIPLCFKRFTNKHPSFSWIGANFKNPFEMLSITHQNVKIEALMMINDNQSIVVRPSIKINQSSQSYFHL